jgi:Tfp pilus assembly protein PilF
MKTGRLAPLLSLALGAAVAAATLSGASAATPAAPAPEQDDPHAACAAPPSYVPADLLERPVPLRKGIGNSRLAVTSKSEEAAAYFSQGLNYLESYVWIEAARSFHQAVRLDPGLALAHVGLSRVFSGLDNPAAARRAFETAKTLAAGASERERRIIDIREKQLAAMEEIDSPAKLLAYRKAIDDALTADFDIPQLWVLRGNAEEANATGRGQRGTSGSIAFYERALSLDPDNASAHHFLVHSYETIGRIDQALVHGEAYARLSPAIPHAAHMWGHDLRRVGRIDEAIVQFKKTDALERAYYEAEGIDPSLDWHHGHNLDLLATCYEHKGQMRLAETTMREATALAPVDAYRAFNMRELPAFLIHRARYAEALEAARSLTRTAYPQSRTVGQALAGQALIRLGRLDEAAKALEAARRELETVPAVTPGIVPRRSAVEPWVESLRGELLLRTGKGPEGRTVLKDVQRAFRAIPGPDAWSQGLFRLEAIARSAIEAVDWDLAEYTARQMLDHDAAYGGSHYVMAQVLRHKGDASGADRELKAARGFWRDADPDLPEMARTSGSPGR